MKVLVVFNHPYEKSYCSSILKSVENAFRAGGCEVDVIHLDRDRFNPAMTADELREHSLGVVSDAVVRGYQERIRWAEHVVFIFPIWWELMPAMTKGFVDRVLTEGFAFETDESKRPARFRNLLTNVRGVTLITTMNTPAVLYSLLFGNAIKKSFFNGTFRKIGVKNLKWISLNMVKFTSQAKREKWLGKIGSYCGRLADGDRSSIRVRPIRNAATQTSHS